MTDTPSHKAFPPRLFPAGRLDPKVMNRILRHRLRNLCYGVGMTLDRIAKQTAGTLPAVAQKCSVVGAEMENLKCFTERLDLLFDALPAAEPVFLHSILSDCRAFFASKFPLCAFAMSGPEAMAVLPAGSLALLALKEILSNAGEAAGMDGKVTLGWEFDSDAGRVVFVVSNSGEPIPSEIPTKPPSPFHTTRGRHDGLGLSIADWAAECAGGSLEFPDAPPGEVHARLQFPAEVSNHA